MRNARVYRVAPDLVSRPGPRSPTESSCCIDAALGSTSTRCRRLREMSQGDMMILYDRIGVFAYGIVIGGGSRSSRSRSDATHAIRAHRPISLVSSRPATSDRCVLRDDMIVNARHLCGRRRRDPRSLRSSIQSPVVLQQQRKALEILTAAGRSICRNWNFTLPPRKAVDIREENSSSLMKCTFKGSLIASHECHDRRQSM